VSVSYQVRNGVAWLTIERPEARNALNKAVRDGLFDGVRTFNADDTAKVLVLTGAGDKAFCAGMDLAEFAAGGGGGNTVAEQTEADDSVVPSRHQIVSWEYPKPIVAALNGAKVFGWTFSGTLSHNPPMVRNKFGGRWVTTEYRAGDFITFGMFTVHASLDNRTADRLRISSDSRYQRASEPIDERWVGANPPGHTTAGKRGKIC